MQAISYTFGGTGASGEGGGTTQVLSRWAPTGMQDGFDNASMRVDFLGDGDAFAAGFLKGTPASKGAAMYISGVQIEREAFGWTTGTVFAQGFWAAGPPDLSVLSISSKEKMWPFDNAFYTYIYDGRRLGRAALNTYVGPYHSGASPWRVRQILKHGTLQREGAVIITGSATAWAGPPAPKADRPPGIINLSTGNTGLLDPLITVSPGNPLPGWLPLGLTPRIVARLGEKTLLAWQDNWEWAEKESE